MKRTLYLIVFLISVNAVLAQYCPTTKVIDGDRTYEIHLNDKERQIWVDFGNNQVRAERLTRGRGSEGINAVNGWQILQMLNGRIEQAKEQNRVLLSRMLLEKKCPNVRPVDALGQCKGQVIMSPEWRDSVVFRPEGVYAAALTITTRGLGECSYFGQDIVPKVKKQVVQKIIEEKGPFFDCINVPPVAFWSRSYTSTYKGRTAQFRVYAYNEWEIHCVNIGRTWEVAKKVEYQEYPSIQPAAVTGGSVGKIETVKRLPEGRLSGVIKLIKGIGPTQVNYVVKDIELRQGQKVKYVQSETGLVTSIEPLSDFYLGKIMTVKKLPGGAVAGIIARTGGGGPLRVNFLVKDVELRQGQKVKFGESATGAVTSVELWKP